MRAQLIFAQVLFKNISLKMPFYAVKRGRQPGVYNTWPECQSQVNEFPQPRFKKFPTKEEAWAFVNDKTPEKPFFSSPSKSSSFSSAGPSSASPEHAAFRAPAQAVAARVSLEPVAAASGPTRISSTRLLALKGTISTMKTLAQQFHQCVTQAEEQIEAIQKGKKRTADEANQNDQSVPHEPVIKRQATSGPVSVYTDGCCHGNGRADSRAGIGVFWGQGDPRNVAEKLPGRPTNNRAEIHAACKAIKQAKEYGISELIIHTDSQFTINGITKWIHKWKLNGWKLASGGQVINKEDFEELDRLLADHTLTVTWVHVDGHSGIPGNEAADRLANEGARL